jgi:curved DNA-binding protein CbpA
MDYYQILGITRFADGDEVKKAFRQKAKQLHPDLNNNNPRANEEFKRINEAYQVLQNPEKRRIYDLQLLNGFPAATIYYRPAAKKVKVKIRYRAKGDKYAHYKSRSQAERRFERFEKVFDLSLFAMVFVLGCLAFSYGMYRLYIEPVENIDPYPGIVMGLLFISVIVYFWVLRKKTDDDDQTETENQ